MSDYMPGEAEFIDTYVSAMSGGCTPIEDPERAAEARRGIAKVKADAWDEGQEAGWNEAEEYWAVEGMVGDFHKHSNVPNPYRIEEQR